MLSHQKDALGGGWVYHPAIKSKKRSLSDCISIAAIEDGFVINKDGSLSVGFEATLFEEELVNEDGLISIIEEFSAACRRLPVGTVIQKLDVYDQDTFSSPIPFEASFFHRKTLEPHNEKAVLVHHSFIYLHYFGVALNPISSFLALGSKLFQNPFGHLAKGKELVQATCQEFMSAMPVGLKLRRLADEENKRLLYQYTSLTFDREPLGFERSLHILPNSLAIGGYLKSVRMKAQADSVYAYRKNNLGVQGVTSPFTWQLTHFAPFPHIICQQLAIIPDQQFRKAKSLELEYSAQLKLSVRSRELAEHLQESLLALEKELNEKDIQLVRFNYHVLVPNMEVLQVRVDHIKSAFGKLGIEADEEADDTARSFLASIPGGSGFKEGLYMPIETAVAHLNFVTPKKGDQQGIILSNRHGSPIYYNPFKYSLDNQHAFVFGPSGSGKSFLNGKLIKDRYHAGHTLVVIDSGGTYRFLFQALGGKYIEYKPDQPLQLNPFLVKQQSGQYIPDSDKLAFLTNFLAKMWKGDLAKNPLTEVEYALLAKALKNYYATLAKEVVPSLIGFCDWLQGYVAKEGIETSLFDLKNFLIVTEPFTQGIYKDHFNALETIYLEDSKLLCFELESIKSNSKLYPLVIKVLFDYVLQLVARQPEAKKFIDIEEGWTMLDDSSQDYIEAFFRKGRKTNTAIRIITQNIDEIKNSPIAGAMKNNASTFMLLYNDKASVREDIASFLGMHDFDKEKYASLRRRDNYIGGYREVFIKEMDRSSVWRIETSLYEHAILTSRPDERHAIAKLIEEEGDIELAVAKWVKQVLAKQ
jgi:conjugal transfer ATP-binding protein TraC